MILTLLFRSSNHSIGTTAILKRAFWAMTSSSVSNTHPLLLIKGAIFKKTSLLMALKPHWASSNLIQNNFLKKNLKAHEENFLTRVRSCTFEEFFFMGF